MEPKGSLPHSQVPAACAYPEPDWSTPCRHIPLPKIRLNIIFSSMPGSSKWSLSLRFPHQNPVYMSTVPQTFYMPHPPHSSQFHHPNRLIPFGVNVLLNARNKTRLHFTNAWQKTSTMFKIWNISFITSPTGYDSAAGIRKCNSHK